MKVESLNVRGMMRNGRLAMSVADTSMGRLVTFIEYKAKWRGRTVEKIDPWFPSSQACSCCGYINTEMRNLSRRVFICPECGHIEGRDRNAARNIFAYRQEAGNGADVSATDVEIGVHVQGESLGAGAGRGSVNVDFYGAC